MVHALVPGDRVEAAAVYGRDGQKIGTIDTLTSSDGATAIEDRATPAGQSQRPLAEIGVHSGRHPRCLGSRHRTVDPYRRRWVADRLRDRKQGAGFKLECMAGFIGIRNPSAVRSTGSPRVDTRACNQRI